MRGRAIDRKLTVAPPCFCVTFYLCTAMGQGRLAARNEGQPQMRDRGWRPWCAAAVVAIGVWGTAGVAQAGALAQPSAPQAVNRPAGNRAVDAGTADQASARASEADPSPPGDLPAPQPPCPIEVPGGVICHGPVFPELPPVSEPPRRTVYLPLMYW